MPANPHDPLSNIILADAELEWTCNGLVPIT
jgi:hypothetical protein